MVVEDHGWPRSFDLESLELCSSESKMRDKGQGPKISPDWCPLRSGPVTLELEESDGE
jgi:hypothetical protein